MSDEIKKAEQLVEQATKRKNQSGFLSKLFTHPEVQFEEAASMYADAANRFKLAREWKRAGDTYRMAAECHRKIDVKHEAASCLQEAALCYKKLPTMDEAIGALEEAMNTYCDMARLSMAAKVANSIGEIYESKGDNSHALEFFEKAADWYDGEDSSGSAGKLWIKVAQLAAAEKDYTKAAEIYSKIAKEMVNSNLLKWSAKEYFMKAALCRMCAEDIAGAKRILEEGEALSAGFRGSREHGLVTNVVKCYENSDADEFTKVIAEFDAVSRLDGWMTNILLQIKKNLTSDDLK